MEEPTNIATFHLNQVGDLLFSLPALYNVRARFPKARITGVARPTCAELLRLSGLVDKVIERPRRPLGSGFRVVSSLRREKLDLALVFSTSFGMRTLAFLCGAKHRIGFAHSISGLLLHQRVPWTRPPCTGNNLRLVEAIGCPIVKADYVGLIRPGQAEQDKARRLLDAAGTTSDDFAVFSPGTSAGREIKHWSDQAFAELADQLTDALGLRSVVLGLDGGTRICSLSRNAIDLTGKISFSVLAAVLARAKVFVGVDSGLTHLAAAAGTPVVALFGPSDPQITGPQGDKHRLVYADLPCRPCLQSYCDFGHKCMKSITTDMVLSAVSSVTDGSRV